MLNELEMLRLGADTRPVFDCGSDDLNEFFHEDSIAWGNQLISVTYAIRSQNKIVAFFSLSNDAIQSEQTPRSAFKRLLKLVPYEKRLRSMPAVKIGRLATSSEVQSNGIGTHILNFIKISLTDNNKTGCRFIVVDAYNNPRTIRFYEKNNFQFMSTNDVKEKTRLMYFDLGTI